MTTPTKTELAAIATTVATPGSNAEPTRSATILPFPARGTSQQPDQQPELRLARALQTLNAAVAEQRQALVAWRNALVELKTTTMSLDASLQRYSGSLKSLGGSVSALNAKARSLENWADKALAQEAPANPA